MEYTSVARFERRRYLMIGHVWNGGNKEKSQLAKGRPSFDAANNAWLSRVLSIHFSLV